MSNGISGLAAYGNSDSESDEEGYYDSADILRRAAVLNNRDSNKASANIEPELETGCTYECKGSVDAECMQRIIDYKKMKNSGFNLVENIASNKEFSNPYFLFEVIKYFDIDEYSSNMSIDVFDPHTYYDHPQDTIEKLSLAVNANTNI